MEAGFNKFNGNYVLIEHGSTYQTKYLHLNEVFVRRNQKVKQRQKIGTVGSTGYSTGPHLHYEFLVNGIHRNPRTVNLPKADPISETEISAFRSTAKTVMRKLDLNKKKSNNVFSK
jgi:murein DD-endopeptidase MepM/ murein hydrolase activator NlpD